MDPHTFAPGMAFCFAGAVISLFVFCFGVSPLPQTFFLLFIKLFTFLDVILPGFSPWNHTSLIIYSLQIPQ